MRLKILSALLIPCVLLTQSAIAFGHSHGGDEPAGHGERAHLHFDWFGSDSGHECKHHHKGHSHHGHGGRHASSAESQSPHDSDAVYFPDVDWGTSPQISIVNGLSLSLMCVAFTGTTPSVEIGIPARPAILGAHGPPYGFDCPSYLSHLALLL